MNVEIRIKRILTHMSRFQYMQGEDKYLGRIFGVYDNSPESDSLFICENGIYWSNNDVREEVVFKDIEDIDFKDRFSD